MKRAGKKKSASINRRIGTKVGHLLLPKGKNKTGGISKISKKKRNGGDARGY